MRLFVARRKERTGFYLPMQGTKEKPSLLFFLPKVERGQLDELIRSQLQKQGITNEADVKRIVDQAETEYERRIKTVEAEKEIRRLMQIKAEGGKLMQVGRRKWKRTFYPNK